MPQANYRFLITSARGHQLKYKYHGHILSLRQASYGYTLIRFLSSPILEPPPPPPPLPNSTCSSLFNRHKSCRPIHTNSPHTSYPGNEHRIDGIDNTACCSVNGIVETPHRPINGSTIPVAIQWTFINTISNIACRSVDGTVPIPLAVRST